jgi:hypothetical protein
MLMFLLKIICLYPSLVDKLWTKCPCWQTVNKMSLLTNCEQNVLVDKLSKMSLCWQTVNKMSLLTNCEQDVLVDKLWTKCPCWQTVNKMSLLTNCEQNVSAVSLLCLFVCLIMSIYVPDEWLCTLNQISTFWFPFF